MMKNVIRGFITLHLVLLFTTQLYSQESQGQNILKADFKYPPKWWQTAINLNDDALKTLVGKEGRIYYDYNPWPCDEMISLGEYLNTFNTEIGVVIPFSDGIYEQKVEVPGIPVLTTRFENDQLSIVQEAFAVGPPFMKGEGPLSDVLLGTSNCKEIYGAPRNDLNIVSYKNSGSTEISVTPEFMIRSAEPITFVGKNSAIRIGEHIAVKLSSVIDHAEFLDSTIKVFDHKEAVRLHVLKLHLSPVSLKPGKELRIALGIGVGKNAVEVPNSVDHAMFLKERTVKYWENLGLPHDKIQVPDPTIQALFQSSVRNIFQAREIKNGLPAFQVGPTRYRGLWIVDGSFLLESMTFLGEIEDVRNGIEYMMSFQNSDGSFELIKEHWKETGIVLWAVTRHARLTGDKEWLNHHWPKLERAFAYIDTMRLKASVDPNAPNYDLIPAGASDGGLWRILPEYTNVYWTMSGMKAAVEAAEWLGKEETAREWNGKYNSFYKRFSKAASRDMKKDIHGNNYLPIYMVENDSVLPQRAQWAFLHAVFPGKVFDRGYPVMEGNMAMLSSVEKEGLVYNTGWHNNGVWNYFGSFIGHALLWNRKGREAAEKLYAIANHASPTLVWREEQELKEDPEHTPVGDMPHNWASAEFIRLTRHLIALERGDELHLFEGVPAEWCRPGMVTSLNGVYTEFGILSLKLKISDDGSQAEVNIDLKAHNGSTLEKIIIHTEGIKSKDKTISIEPNFPVTYTIKI